MTHLMIRPIVSHKDAARIHRSEDAAVMVTLARTQQGVFVQRVNRCDGTAAVIHSTLFKTRQDFDRWCDADLLRFRYPRTFIDVQRSADTLFGHDR